MNRAIRRLIAPYDPTQKRSAKDLRAAFSWMEGGQACTALLRGPNFKSRDLLSRLIFGARGLSLIVG